jgi:lipopolysaccharide export system ATP-binding protein
MQNETFLEARHLAKRYKARWVVKDVSIKVNAGEVVGLLGPNGAGKTTAFYMMVGLISPNRGEIFLGHENLTHLPMHRRARLGIGYLPQENSVFRKLSTEDNIMAILELQDLSEDERYQRLEFLLNDFHIQHIRKNLGMSLSGGERRRLEIARSLAAAPKFILLDEPFAGIDPISVSDIKSTIDHLKRKKIGIVITDHNVRETLDICDRAYIVNAGEIIAEGNAQAILNNEQVKQVYLGTSFRL